MTDCFALLDLPRQPWLDPELVKEQFNALSARFHPDKVECSTEEARVAATARFADLNLAYQTLREAKSRLAHLIQLESGAAPASIEQVSNESADLFFEVSGLCRKVDQFLGDKAKSTSPLLKAAQFAQALEWTDRLQQLQQSIVDKRTALEGEVHQLNGAWAASPDLTANSKNDSMDRLKEIYAKLGYLSRWNAQLQERIVQLSV